MKVRTEIFLRMEVGMPQESWKVKGPVKGCACGCGGPGGKLRHAEPHTCVCSSCGREINHNPGDPCRAGICPHCGGKIHPQV